MYKMWSAKNGMILFCVWYISCVSLSEESCDYNYRGFGFKELNVSKPAEEINLSLVNETSSVMMVVITKRNSDFNLTLLCIPSIKNSSDCPFKLSGKEDLQQYGNTCIVYKNANESDPIYFGQISAGCYYLIATDAEGNNWEFGPQFLNTNLPFYNTALRLENEVEVMPESTNETMVLIFSLRVPLSCINVRVQLFQFDGKIDALDDIRNMIIPGSQECWFTKNETGVVQYDCKGSKLITNLTLQVTIYEQNKNEKEKEWIAGASWKGLQKGGGTYYLWIGSYTDFCEKLYGRDNVTTWVPIRKDILKPLGHRNDSDTGSQKSIDDIQKPVIIYMLCMSLGVILIAIFAFLKCKYFIALRRNLQGNTTPYEFQESVPLHADKKKSNNILLMYVRGSPEFMNEIDNFRSLLEQACHCHVYDLYTIDEWESIASLGATEWVEKLVKDGNKIIWVDTPQFRSRFNDKQDKLFTGDFRDEAIPHAVTLAKNLFHNATTQYCCHFVVRVEGFEVTDESHPDPLLVVSPHMRYRIPDHLSLLYEHLRDPAAMDFEKKNKEH